MCISALYALSLQRNVFDGTRWLGDDPSSGFLVRGVDSDRVGVPPVGLLSELETYRYLAVGMPLGRASTKRGLKWLLRCCMCMSVWQDYTACSAYHYKFIQILIYR